MQSVRIGCTITSRHISLSCQYDIKRTQTPLKAYSFYRFPSVVSLHHITQSTHECSHHHPDLFSRWHFKRTALFHRARFSRRSLLSAPGDFTHGAWPKAPCHHSILQRLLYRASEKLPVTYAQDPPAHFLVVEVSQEEHAVQDTAHTHPPENIPPRSVPARIEEQLSAHYQHKRADDRRPETARPADEFGGGCCHGEVVLA